MKHSSSKATAEPLAYLRTCLKSYGVVAFAPHPVPATLMLLATFYYPLAGLMGITGNLIASLTARWLHPVRAVRESGIFGVNGILVGLALAKYSVPSMKIWVLLILGAGLAGILSTALAGYFAKYDLPILSIPFTAVVWLLLLTPGTAAGHETALTSFTGLQNIDLWLFSKLPYVLFEYLKMFGSIFFQSNLLSGVLVLAAIAIYSRISVIAGLWGGFLGMLVYVFIHGSLIGFDGLNYVLIALAMGGFFVVHSFRSVGLMTAAILMVGLVEAGTRELLQSSGLPLLIFPFNLVAILLLFPLKNILSPENSKRPVPIPLYLIKSPESNLRWYRRWVLYSSRQKTLLTMPFLGEWSVLQGNDGEWTHKGTGRYAWDFVVRDQSGSQLKGFGNRVEDYYAYGLPVLAPAPGMVFAVENRVNDNPPQTANTEQNWGNYVIIDHQNGEYSELSHLKQGSVVVKPGQYLQRGELIGYCGNSGRSPVPHIHYQLQQEGRLSSVTIPANFSEGLMNGQILVHFVPEHDARVGPLESDTLPLWTLLGKETDVWVYRVRESLLKFRESLTFSTDEFGNPAILGKDNRLWHIIDMPHFIEIRPDFKTYPSLINPSLWIDIVGERLILPKILRDGFKWKDGEVRASERMPGCMVVITANRKIVIDPSGRLSEMSLVDRSDKIMTLIKIQHKT
ncbi:MAG: peptidoglycan DD-metalloendopeptidase family protein [FCB group bacterium]|nr:peptidoglycan DD-metalloendopeptidase family protein [FCB group bacterium]